MDKNDPALDNKFNEIVSRTLKKYREESHMSLEEVVKKMKNPITRQMLFKYENNLARIKHSVFVDICQAIGIDSKEVYQEINLKTIEIGSDIGKNIDEIIEVPLRDFKTGEITKGYTGATEKLEKFDELELLFDKHKDILTDSDKNIIKTIIEERKKEIDKELGEE